MSCLISLTIILNSGVLFGPFRIAEAEPGHHQVHLNAAMAPDGNFAVSWLDSLKIDQFTSEVNLHVRFFDEEGNPLTEPAKMPREEGNYIRGPCLEMDTSGSVVLVWSEVNRLLQEYRTFFQAFSPAGEALDTVKMLFSGREIGSRTVVGLGFNNEGEFAYSETSFGPTSFQRFDLEGTPLNSWVLAEDSSVAEARCSQLTLNDEGEIAVTWLEGQKTGEMFPSFQVFDAQDEPILPWAPKGHHIDERFAQQNGTRPMVHWLDNERFMVLWVHQSTVPYQVLARVYENEGLTKTTISCLVADSLGPLTDADGVYDMDVLPDGRFVYAHTRSHYDYPDTADPWYTRTWEHAAGIIGRVENNVPLRMTTLFEYSPPLGEDTISSLFDHWCHYQSPAVACSNDRIVWLYTHLNTDTIFEAYALISDWDMGEAIKESSPSNHPLIELASPIGSEVVLRYHDCPGGFHAYVFDATGRKVDEVHNHASSGTVSWGEGQQSGVYFIKELSGGQTVRKVVLLR